MRQQEILRRLRIAVGGVPTFRVYRRRRVRGRGVLAGTRKEYETHKESARTFVTRKLHQFNLHYRVTFGRVSIRNQRTRWGSCSMKGNLNFHYKLVLIPEHLADYVIVHELCHRKEFNHSRRFWDLVAEQIPEHRAHRRSLRALGNAIELKKRPPNDSGVKTFNWERHRGSTRGR